MPRRARRAGARSSGRRSSASRSQARGRARSSASGARRRSAAIDVDLLTESVVDEVVRQLGLDLLGLERAEYVEMLKPLVAGLVDQYSSKPSRQTIVSRLVSNPRPVYLMAAAYVLERRQELTEDQVEFILSNAPEMAAKHVSKLYREAVRHGRGDLVAMLRAAWERYGSPTPVACPRCGFRALTPDLVCIVCGYEASEEEVKRAVDFEERLRELVEFYGPAEAREAAERGYVILGEFVKPPTAQREPMDIVLHLNERERELLRRMIAEQRTMARG